MVAAARLPIVAPDLGADRWIELMQVDKKNVGGEIQFVLLRPLGSALVTTVPEEMLRATITACTRQM